MKNDLVSINGELRAFGDAFGAPDGLLAANFVYQKMNVLGYAPLRAEWHAEIAEISYQTLYGTNCGLDTEALNREVHALLTANRYPRSGVLVSLYLMPAVDGSGQPVRLLSCEKQLVFKDYALWNTGLKCIVLPYEYPYPQFRTAASLAAHTYATDYARRMGADAAICENRAGMLTGVGENPLFVSENRMVFTPPLDDAIPDSAERRLVIEACHRAGITIAERVLTADTLTNCDELFTVTPQGFASIRQYAGQIYPHSLARHLAEQFKQI
ncbi:aminotransferase class IV [Alistipes sp. OttesenSCG-928-B03]|nr:aminotransferase class IV [Alistipes sp. OttesenSCG-928-B03]